MHSIQPLTRAASFSGPLSPSNTVLGKRRALADDEGVDVDVEQPNVKRSKGCAVLTDEWDARANKENVPPFARGTGPRRPTALSRRASTGPGLGAGSAPTRLRRSVSYASAAPVMVTKSDAPGALAWAFSLPDDASSLSSSP